MSFLPELPCEVISLILSSLNDPSKCAAACLARAWRDAAASPHLWKKVGVFPGAVVRLTDAGLASLVKRAAGGLKQLYLPKVCLITREGLAAALTPRQNKLSVVQASRNSISGADIAAALTTYRGRLRKLKVCGIRAVTLPPDGVVTDQTGFRASCNNVIGALRALLVPGGDLDAEAVCVVEVCARLSTREGTCSCGVVFCKVHAGRMNNCMGCGKRICDDCTFGAEWGGPFSGPPQCEDCGAMSGNSDFDGDDL